MTGPAPVLVPQFPSTRPCGASRDSNEERFVTDTRTYVLDTSVLLADPWACSRFGEHEVVVPLVVISELEAKRHHHELGWFARQALRLFDDLRLEHGRPGHTSSAWTEGGTRHCWVQHTD